MRYKGATPNFFLVNPTSAFDGLVASAVRILSYGSDQKPRKSITADPNLVNLFQQERKFLAQAYDLARTNDNQADFVVQWEIPKLKKKGFYSLFNVIIKQRQVELCQ